MKALLVALLFLFTFSLTPLAYAHFTLEDHGTRVQLHINPGDNPIANQKADLIFMFQKRDNNFQIEDCNCTASIYHHGEKIFTQQLSSNLVDYVFHQKDVYTLELRGQPRKANAFQPFVLKWDIRVDRDNNDPQFMTTDKSTMITYGIIAGVIVCFILIMLVKRKR
jgi:hypothetical protein